jgi:glycosidase
LPAVNKHNPEYIDFITGKNGVLAKYTKMGIGGWRLDVVDELHGDFVKAIRRAVKSENPEAVVIGEVWEDASNKIAYGVRREYFLGDELDSVMNYPLKNAILNFVTCRDVSVLSNTIKEQVDHYPFSVLCSLMNLLSTHDTVRLLSAVSGINVYGKTKEEQELAYIPETEYKGAVERLKTAVLLQYTLPGVPSVYYGDEVGMQGFIDPLNRRCYPWGKENKEILEYYKKLGQIRSSFSAFESGEYNIIKKDNK